MAIAGFARDEPAKMKVYVESMARAKGISETIEAVREYLDSWSKERIANLQKLDGGWAPFDASQRPLRILSAAAVHCIRNAIHRHCIALREANIDLSPELAEFDALFSIASERIENIGRSASASTRRIAVATTRTPPIPLRTDVLMNW
jgi:hypothetical protein